MTSSFASRRWSLFVLPLLLASGLMACGDSAQPIDPATGEVSEALFANDKTIYDYFVGKGLTPFQAAGIVGNLDQESGGDPNAAQSGGPGRGIAQWSVGGRWDTDANDNATAFAASKGQSVHSLGLQLDFIWYELTTFSGYGLAALKASTNVTDATVAFQDKFEGCGTCDQTKRVQYAKDVLAAYGAAAPSYAAKFVSQTYPYASVGPIMLKVGETVTGSIVMQNTGTKAWKAGSTKLAPIPRDQASPFQSPSWPTNARVSTVSADVAPGANGTFEWDLTGSVPGDFSPFFGFVEEGVTWFADGPDGGGPPDNDVQVHIVVAPAPGMGAGGSGTAGSGGAGEAGKGGTTAAGGKGGSPATGAGGSPATGAGGAPAQGAGGAATQGTGGAAAGGKGAGVGGAAGSSVVGGAATGGKSAATGAGGTGAGGDLAGGGNGGAAGGPNVTVVEDDTIPGSSGGCGVAPAPGTWSLVGLLPFLALTVRRRREKQATGRR